MRKDKFKAIIALSITSTVLLFLIIFFTFFKIIIISGQSMSPTLNDHQIVLILKTKNIKKNDIIVFSFNNQELIKRVIGIEGDIIELKDGYVFKNNIQLSYTYLENENKKYILKSNEYFVIGDNFNASTDSRSFGIINNDIIEGKMI